MPKLALFARLTQYCLQPFTCLDMGLKVLKIAEYQHVYCPKEASYEKLCQKELVTQKWVIIAYIPSSRSEREMVSAK